MATVYIIFSEPINKFYVGYTTEIVELRIERHNNKYYYNKYTSIGIPWSLFLEIQCESIEHALKVEKRIKSMKSKVYIQNLKQYPEMVIKLKEKCLL
jgi:putative endonuclease